MNRALLDRWLKIVEAQLAAARTLNGAQLARYTRDRVTLQDQLTLPGLIALNPADRAYARQIIMKIRELDRRIASCARIVMDSLALVVPTTTPTTYTARGYLRG